MFCILSTVGGGTWGNTWGGRCLKLSSHPQTTDTRGDPQSLWDQPVEPECIIACPKSPPLVSVPQHRDQKHSTPQTKKPPWTPQHLKQAECSKCPCLHTQRSLRWEALRPTNSISPVKNEVAPRLNLPPKVGLCSPRLVSTAQSLEEICSSGPCKGREGKSIQGQELCLNSVLFSSKRKYYFTL